MAEKRATRKHDWKYGEDPVFGTPTRKDKNTGEKEKLVSSSPFKPRRWRK
jgi:hypothetical protein